MAIVRAALRRTAELAGTHKELQRQGKKKKKKKNVEFCWQKDEVKVAPETRSRLIHRNNAISFVFCTMTNKRTQLFHKLSHYYILHYDQQMHNYFTNYHTIIFCTMTNKCTIISQIITLLHFAL